MDNETLIQIKGIREGILISAQTGSWEERKEEILKLVHEKEAFFSGARACLDVGETTLRVREITQLRDKLSDLKITLWAILSQSEVTSNNASALGLEIAIPVKKDNKGSAEKIDDTGERAVIIKRTLRAGYKVEAREHVIVVGDVNPGAEIVSAGDIIVWGKLKGSAIAGVEGNLKAVICALELKPTQLRIGEIVFPPMMRKGKLFPEEAFIENNECKIEIWNKEKGK
jgi:septum site-determining protein MinC